ncbi:hypothetical protein SUGI_0979850 [Cryptomeria japonica]|nr:hypothetical protein SUGI_0979850 [Cryptomeria japonica]
MAQESWKKMEEESGPQPPEGPIMCSNKCGFFGSSATMNMCSKCYRDYVLDQTKASKIKAAVEKSLAVDSNSSEKSVVVRIGAVRAGKEPRKFRRFEIRLIVTLIRIFFQVRDCGEFDRMRVQFFS